MLSKTLQIPLPDGALLELVLVAGGEFAMGGDEFSDEQPIHQVRISSFYLGRYPMTQAQYRAVTGNNPSKLKGENRPVEMVTWLDAQGFVEQLGKKTGHVFRLPTEAEWEFAARGGRKSKGFRFAGSDRLEEVGWHGENSYGGTKPVGLKLANELGLHDMSGNVWEWCQDWYSEKYYEKCRSAGCIVDPLGPESGDSRVLRGGSYFNNAENCRAAARFSAPPWRRDDAVGFRLVVSCQSGG